MDMQESRTVYNSHMDDDDDGDDDDYDNDTK